MRYEDFILPAKSELHSSGSQRWADLGCGSGVFTRLLAGILPFNSEIVAVDKEGQRLDSMMGNQVSVLFQQADFGKDELHIHSLDGILMANSFHYIHDKELLIRKLEPLFSGRKQFLIAEYETGLANPWVPYPIKFEELKQLFQLFGYSSAEKLSVRKSAYGGEMYLAFVC